MIDVVVNTGGYMCSLIKTNNFIEKNSFIKTKTAQLTATFFLLLAANGVMAESEPTMKMEAGHDHSMMEMKPAGEEVQVVGAWIMAPPGPNAAGYLKITNNSDKPLKLLDAESDVAARVELHTHVLQDGVMKMMKMDDVIIDPHQTHAFAQGGDHVMFMGLKQPLKPGQIVDVELRFEKHPPVSFKTEVMGMEEAAKKISVHSH